MSDPFLAEIKLVSFPFAPRGWALCNGQLLSINQNQALFALLGTQYGGNGVTTFALPDLRGRVPRHTSDGTPGASGGAISHTLSQAELPSHSHTLLGSGTPSHAADPAGRVMGSTEANGINVMHSADASAALHPAALSSSGGSQPHTNMQPYTTTNFIIALQGIFPSRN
jgi:microcystin-dependent protein